MTFLFCAIRFTTSLSVLDYSTVGGTDKFGNVFVLRAPQNVHDDVENSTGIRMLWDQGLLNGAPSKLDMMTHYYLGEMATTSTLRALVPGGRDALLVATVMGGIYAFVPLTAKEDFSFFQHVEMFMRQEKSNLCQRDHLSYRSYFLPVKHTYDGDLCELLTSMPPKKQAELGEDVNRSTSEMQKKLEDVRNSLL